MAPETYQLSSANTGQGAYCTRPAFGATLQFDKPDDATKRARRTSAACRPHPNRCSPKHDPPFPQGNSCDEYPFASTSNTDAGGQTNLCVPKEQNSGAQFSPSSILFHI